MNINLNSYINTRNRLLSESNKSGSTRRETSNPSLKTEEKKGKHQALVSISDLVVFVSALLITGIVGLLFWFIKPI